MKITRPMLKQAENEGLLSPQQTEPLWDFLQERNSHIPSFNTANILYYFGGLITIGALSLFMTLGWEQFGGWGIFGLSMLYALLGLGLTELLLTKYRLTIPAGIAAALVVAVTPLAVYGLQLALGLWADGHFYRDYHYYVDWRWLLMELATLASAAVMLWRYRLPFLLLPVIVTLWYLAMDLVVFLFNDYSSYWEVRRFFALWSGILMVLLAFWVDIRTSREKDFSFWLYLGGVLSFWLALTLKAPSDELGRFFYMCINLAMIALGAMLARKVFVVCGGLGVASCLGYLSHRVFENSLLFPLCLTLIGFALLFVGILWQRHEKAFRTNLLRVLPQQLRNLVEGLA